MSIFHHADGSRRRSVIASVAGGGVLLVAAVTLGAVQAQQGGNSARPGGYDEVWSELVTDLPPFADPGSVLPDLGVDGADLHRLGTVDGADIVAGQSSEHGICMVYADPATEVVAVGCGEPRRVEAGGLALSVITPRGPVGELYMVPDGVAGQLERFEGVERIGENLVRVDRRAADTVAVQRASVRGGFELELLPSLDETEGGR